MHHYASVSYTHLRISNYSRTDETFTGSLILNKYQNSDKSYCTGHRDNLDNDCLLEYNQTTIYNVKL